jgi:hypothetical protein
MKKTWRQKHHDTVPFSESEYFLQQLVTLIREGSPDAILQVTIQGCKKKNRMQCRLCLLDKL